MASAWIMQAGPEVESSDAPELARRKPHGPDRSSNGDRRVLLRGQRDEGCTSVMPS